MCSRRLCSVHTVSVPVPSSLPTCPCTASFSMMITGQLLILSLSTYRSGRNRSSPAAVFATGITRVIMPSLFRFQLTPRRFDPYTSRTPRSTRSFFIRNRSQLSRISFALKYGIIPLSGSRIAAVPFR